ncbi:MAG: DNA polymerase III subunit epsilon [Alphaproteobacteria bacterium]|nr:DNA polymerase III subunit epsilon [Alphaproteobacteria bacterium]
MREVVLDTETTGLDPLSGHRLVEIGCIELFNHLPTGRIYQTYLNPERDMPTAAFEVHGLSDEFLADKPRFAEVVDDFLAFIGSDEEERLVIHNAEFDMRFINAELTRLGRAIIPMTRAVDTVRLARQKFPGAQASLDALCRRFGIDNSARTKHGALLDAELLAEVYLELVGGRQPGLVLGQAGSAGGGGPRREFRPPRPHGPSAAELARHEAFIARFVKDAIWQKG